MLDHTEQETTIALCQQLVRSASVSGHEQQAVQALHDFMQRQGFDEIRIDEYGSIVGVLRGRHPGPKILFDGHLDTVPVPNPEAWTQDPLGGARVDGKIYGRGTTDMKGAVAAMASAAGFFAAHSGREFAGEVYVSGVVHEECFEGIAARAVSQWVQPDLVVIGEPSGLALKIGQRGRAEIVVETFGVPAHSALPHKGVNAVHLMCRLIAALEDIAVPQDAVLGPGVAVLTDIISTPYPGASVVPSHCRATYDRRLLVGETPEGVLQPYQQIIQRLQQAVPGFKAQVSYASGTEACYTGREIQADRFFPGWCAGPIDPHVQQVLSGLRQAGLDAPIGYFPFCTNGSHYAGEAGIPTVGFGPSYEYLAHVVDEYIEEDQLLRATAGYMGICRAFLAS